MIFDYNISDTHTYTRMWWQCRANLRRTSVSPCHTEHQHQKNKRGAITPLPHLGKVNLSIFGWDLQPPKVNHKIWLGIRCSRHKKDALAMLVRKRFQPHPPSFNSISLQHIVSSQQVQFICMSTCMDPFKEPKLFLPIFLLTNPIFARHAITCHVVHLNPSYILKFMAHESAHLTSIDLRIDIICNEWYVQRTWSANKSFYATLMLMLMLVRCVMLEV